MKLSIITVNLNNLAGLQKTMQSVFEQTFTDYEYIIIDGGSADGSKEYIEQHADKLAYWVSEKDGGVYEAMNKGIRKSSGLYLLFLNSGDFILDKNKMRECFEFINEPNGSIFYGNMKVKKQDELISKKYPRVLTFEYLISNPINHQSTFINKKAFDRLGLYSYNYRYASDHLFFLRAMMSGFKFYHLPMDIVYYDLNGLSANNWGLYKEEMEKIEENEVPDLLKQFHIDSLKLKNLMSKKIFKYALNIDKAYMALLRHFYRQKR